MNRSLLQAFAICLLSGCAQLPVLPANGEAGSPPVAGASKVWTPWGAYANKKAAKEAAVASAQAQRLAPAYAIKLGKSLAATLRANAAAIAELPLEEQALLDEYAQRVEVLAPGNRAVDASYRKFYTEELPEHDLKWALAQMRASRTIQKKDLSDVSQAPPEGGSAFALRNPQAKSLSGLRPLKASPPKAVKGRLADYRFVPLKGDKPSVTKGGKGVRVDKSVKGDKGIKGAKPTASKIVTPARAAKGAKATRPMPTLKPPTKASPPTVSKKQGAAPSGKSAKSSKRAVGH